MEKKTLRFKTKSQIAYESLKTGIIRGVYKPGSNLMIHAIARSFSMSESPIREALNKLEAERLVSNTPHVGFIVTQPDFKNQSHIFDIRQLLEGHAIWLAASRISSNTLDKLRDIIKEMEKRGASNDMARLAELNQKFHNLIYSSCENVILYNLIQQVWAMVPRTRSIFSLIKGRAQSSIREHKNIYRYLVARDAEKAKQALIKHKQKSYDLLIKYKAFNLNTLKK